MSNVSLKEQLQAVASQFEDPLKKESKPKEKIKPVEKKSSQVARPDPGANPGVNPNHGAKPSKGNAYLDSTIKKPKPKWLEYVQYGVELLKVYLPDSFKSPNDVRPLKKGIKQDLVKRLSTIAEIVTEDKACMVKSLAYYVNTAAYHKSVVEGAVRIDIDGSPAGVVTSEEAKYSHDRYQAKMKAKNKDN